MNMKRVLMLCLAAIMSLSMFAAKASKEVSLKVGDETRKYYLYVPSNAKANAPLVFSLHGTGGSSNDKAPFRMDVADKYGCIVVYPQGKNLYFPVFGGTLPGWHSTGETSEDIDFFKAIIEDVNKTYTVDRNRIYCCGFSNGGMMTYTVANVASDIFAAFASISGFPLNEFHLHHTSARPFPFLHIHGKNDDFVKYSLVPTIVDNIVARNGANPVPEVKTVQGKYRKSVYNATEGSFPYIYYEIDGMGHNDFTNNTEDNNSAITMWKFMSQYTLDTPRDESLRWKPNIDVEGWEPKNHGWRINTSTILATFGKDLKTDANQNVYHSLQFENGRYKLCFMPEGDTEKTVTVKLQKLTGKKNTILNQTVHAGEPATLVFEVTDGWGEYKLTMTRKSSGDAITIKDLTIHVATDEEFTHVSQQLPSAQPSSIYSLTGQKLTTETKGINIKIKNHGVATKVLVK